MRSPSLETTLLTFLSSRAGLCIGYGLFIIIFFSTWIYYPISRGHSGDFLAALSHRDNPYNYFFGNGFFYGPVFSLIDQIFWGKSDQYVSNVMFVVNLALLFAILFLIREVFLPSRSGKSETTLLAIIFVSFYPTFQALRQNNIEILELFFLILMLYALKSKKDTIAGVWLGLAAATKLIPIVLIPYFFWRKRRRLSIVSTTVLAAVAFVASKLKGEDTLTNLADWFSTGSVQFPPAFQANQALSGFIWRLFSEFDYSTRFLIDYPVTSDVATAALTTNAITTFGALGYILYLLRSVGLSPKCANFTITALETGQILLISLLLLPHNHTHYFILICWTYILLLKTGTSIQIAESRFNSRAWEIVLIISFLLLGAIHFMRVIDPLLSPWGSATAVDYLRLFSSPFLGAFLLLISLLRMHGLFIKETQSAKNIIKA
jgi:hypothetical protein